MKTELQPNTCRASGGGVLPSVRRGMRARCMLQIQMAVITFKCSWSGSKEWKREKERGGERERANKYKKNIKCKRPGKYTQGPNREQHIKDLQRMSKSCNVVAVVVAAVPFPNNSSELNFNVKN